MEQEQLLNWSMYLWVEQYPQKILKKWVEKLISIHKKVIMIED